MGFWFFDLASAGEYWYPENNITIILKVISELVVTPAWFLTLSKKRRFVQGPFGGGRDTQFTITLSKIFFFFFSLSPQRQQQHRHLFQLHANLKVSFISLLMHFLLSSSFIASVRSDADGLRFIEFVIWFRLILLNSFAAGIYY